MIQVYTQFHRGQAWLKRYQECLPIFACILGFTQTGLISGISAAGATPNDRKYTALADAEFLINGIQPHPTYPLPPLTVGASPVYISRAVVESFNIPVYLFNSGLPEPPCVPHINLQGMAARCLSSGQALPLDIVEHLFYQGMSWGEKLAQQAKNSYLMIGECVVGGTTTALSILTGLGVAAQGKVNSSHPQCNHEQKWLIVQEGLKKAIFSHPLELIASVGDPMQVVAAGMAITASHTAGVLLAGGTQMLAVYALIQALKLPVNWENIVVGTTRWVAEDPTGDTIGLAEQLKTVPLLATQLNFSQSICPQLLAYERGFVKEGVGAGGCAIASHLYSNWTNEKLVKAIENKLLQNLH
ncbi:TIGR00303 family protein [Aphanothece hegewaldii CCALA 016]|uniref:UPF0284 protein C7H19_17250 n=1 Tax=Aphanothece hegewaldii CCALA 016 TaxID=2107694 RepID=A0A2T1LUR8_9CHRO|nr:TIGR00303 family protein [Aphanothece hegewaldii]PSF35305.1 TIGR00303 family protein [Aphanothece hegewaldii CCALA 016]